MSRKPPAQRRSRLTVLLLALLIALSVPQAAIALDLDLPDLGNSAGNLMTPKRERELGKAFMRWVRKSQDVIDDPVLQDYVQGLGLKLVDHSNLGGTSYTFFLIDNPQINAFAGPGGFIGLNTGLLLTTDTESELAAVVAHEIAHVSQQHLLRTWESTSRMSVPNAALLLAAIALGAAVGGDAAVAAAAGGQAAIQQQQINFTRANEKEADRVGIDILANAGFEPRAMPSFFTRMQTANRIYASKLPEYLRTHPVTSNRTADAQGRAERYPYRQPTGDLGYQFARANLMQRAIARPEDAVRDLTLMLEDGRFRSEDAIRYGIALALLRAKRFDDAAEALDQLLKKRPGRVELAVARAEADNKRGRIDNALGRLRKVLDQNPGSLALTMAHAETALAAGKPDQAEQNILRYLQIGDATPRLYRLLARSANDQDKRAIGHEYLALAHREEGELEQAIRQLEIALETPGLGFYDSSRLEAQLAALKSEQAEAEER